MNRRQFIHSIAGAGFALTGATFAQIARAQPLDLNEAISIAGRQRMLSQRMAKAWLAWGQNIEPAKAERVLAQSISVFDKQLSELTNAPFDSAVSAALAELDVQWKSFKPALISQAPDKSRAAALLALDDKVLQAAQQTTAQIERLSAKSLGKMVNLAGRQRMLSQRAAKVYLASSWGVDARQAQSEIAKVRVELSSALQTLRNARETTPGIRAELEIAAQQWVILDNALSHRIADTQLTLSAQHAAEVFTASENILSQMERVTGLYAKLKTT